MGFPTPPPDQAPEAPEPAPVEAAPVEAGTAAPAGSYSPLVCTYPVQQPDGSTRLQLVLVTGQENGRLTGRALCYVDEQASFLPGQLSAL